MNNNLPYGLAETLPANNVGILFENSLRGKSFSDEDIGRIITHYNTNFNFKARVLEIYSAVMKDNENKGESRKSDLDLIFLLAALETDIEGTIEAINSGLSMFHTVTRVDRILYESAEDK